MEGLTRPAERGDNEQEERISRISSAYHHVWQDGYKASPGNHAVNGALNPHQRPTEDAAWTQAHGTDQVDLSSTPYEELPRDWQEELRASAVIAVNLVAEARAADRVLDDTFVEEASAVIHERWRERHASSAAPTLDLPYADLPEAEKDKDRSVVRLAMRDQSPAE